MGVESIWQYNTIHDCICQVIGIQTLWGDTTYRVWLPGSDSVVHIPAANLKPLEDTAILQNRTGITYSAAATRVAEMHTNFRFPITAIWNR